MKCLSWNCWGIGNAPTVRDLVSLVKENNSQLVFLCETRQKSEKVHQLRSRLGLRGFVGVDSNGRSGGLALFWHESLYVEIKAMNERYIDVYVRVSQDEPIWHLTCVYGEPRTENQHLMWSLLCDIKQRSDLPWMVMGDFNEALRQFEHASQNLISERHMQTSRNVLHDCDLKDLGFEGYPFTYNNRRDGRRNVRVRLDRAVANDSWRDLFSAAAVTHLISPCSDHCPILVQLQQESKTMNRRKCLHYEIM